jgi:AraC-like DNA-binding protein
MPESDLLIAVDLLLRGGAVPLLLALAALVLRDHGRLVVARLAALFALGAAAYALCSAAGLAGHGGWWRLPIRALATGNNLVFWLFARALFDDGFRPRPWHAALWLLIVAIGFLDGVVPASSSPAAALVDDLLGVAALLFAALAVVPAVASWRGDLVERRRRLRLFVVAAAAAQIGLTALAGLLGARRAAPLAVGLLETAGLLLIVGTIAWSLLRAAADEALFPAVCAPAPHAARPPGLDSAERALVAALEQTMTVQRAYRQEGLTIGRLAEMQGLPEYRLRRLINQGLGHRNFNSFLNRYRIADAKAALADPAQEAVPILTIALDAGFSSLGPFNRAFKAETGTTPSDFRRSALADSGIGEPVSATAARAPNSARKAKLPAS